MRDVPPIPVLTLWAGIGGMSYGFHQNPAFEVIGALESDVDAALVYHDNLGAVTICGDREMGSLAERLLLSCRIGQVHQPIVLAKPPLRYHKVDAERWRDTDEYNARIYIEVIKYIMGASGARVICEFPLDAAPLIDSYNWGHYQYADHGLWSKRERLWFGRGVPTMPVVKRRSIYPELDKCTPTITMEEHKYSERNRSRANRAWGRALKLGEIADVMTFPFNYQLDQWSKDTMARLIGGDFPPYISAKLASVLEQEALDAVPQ